MMSDPVVIWEEGRLLLNEYLLERILGRGSIGAVWRVESLRLAQHFAVKTARFADDRSRLGLTAELVSWMSLPTHPNLLPCLFFRTVEDTIVIFTEYADRGSLLEFTQADRLTCPQQIFDIAGQIAGGLAQLHGVGVAHLDVKPGNILLTSGGRAKVGDFGIGRMRSFAEGISAPAVTRAYACPEVATLLSQKNSNFTAALGSEGCMQADVWSWGATVLELLIGYRSWATGEYAGQALAAYIAGDIPDAKFPPAGHYLSDILLRALDSNPKHRWRDMKAVTNSMQGVGARVRQFFCKARRPSKSQWKAAGDWEDPAVFLQAGDACDESERLPGPDLHGMDSARMSALVDLFRYENVEVMCRRLPNAESGARVLSELLRNKARILIALSDTPGAHACFWEAERLLGAVVSSLPVAEVPGIELEHALLNARVNEVSYRLAPGPSDRQRQLEELTACIADYERLESAVPSLEVKRDLANAYANLARVESDAAGAQRASSRACRIMRALVRETPSEGLTLEFCRCLTNHALVLNSAVESRPLLDEALEALELLPVNEQNPRVVHARGRVLFLRGSFGSESDPASAASELARAASALETVLEEYPSSLAELALCLGKQAGIVSSLESAERAGELLDKAIGFIEPAVFEHGRVDLAETLRGLVFQRAAAAAIGQDAATSLRLNRYALEMVERLYRFGSEGEFGGELDETYSEVAVDSGVVNGDEGKKAVFRRACDYYLRIASAVGWSDALRRAALWSIEWASLALGQEEVGGAGSPLASVRRLASEGVGGRLLGETAIAVGSCAVLECDLELLLDEKERACSILTWAQEVVGYAARTDRGAQEVHEEVRSRLVYLGSPIDVVARSQAAATIIESAPPAVALYVARDYLAWMLGQRQAEEAGNGSGTVVVRACDAAISRAVNAGQRAVFEELAKIRTRIKGETRDLSR